MESTVDTDYNALVLEARKRFSSGLLYSVNYTLAKSEDNGQTSTTFFSSNQAYDGPTARTNDVDSVMTPSNNDRRHRFVGELPLPAGLHVGHRRRRHPDARVRAAHHAAHQRVACRRRWARCSRARPTAPAARPWRRGLGFNSERQTGRKTFDIRAAKEFRLGGTAKAQVLWEVFNLFNTENYATFGDTAFDVVTAATTTTRPPTSATVVVRPNTGFLVPTHGQLELLGHARHAAGAQADLLDRKLELRRKNYEGL